MATVTPTAMDPLFGIHADALKIQRSRMEVLASNVANADTPNYLARDIDFADVLTKAQQKSTPDQLVTTHANHIGNTPDLALPPPLSYRVPLQPSVDGNTVDSQIEQAAFADATLHYQAALNFVDGSIKSTLTAITGQ